MGMDTTGADFGVNDVVTVGAVTYIGYTANDQTWMVERIDTTAGVEVRYATLGNNPAYITYPQAWAARATMTYNTFDGAF